MLSVLNIFLTNHTLILKKYPQKNEIMIYLFNVSLSLADFIRLYIRICALINKKLCLDLEKISAEKLFGCFFDFSSNESLTKSKLNIFLANHASILRKCPYRYRKKVVIARLDRAISRFLLRKLCFVE